VSENFLELVNNMLTIGVVSALFAQEDKDGMMDYVRDDVKALGMVDTPGNCWKVFIDRWRYNLHIVLCFSPSGDDLRRRCRDFPGTVINTVIDWFDPWPDEALAAVAQHFVEIESILISLKFLPPIASHMVMTHQQVIIQSNQFSYQPRRPVHVTPTNFLDYISSFRRLLNEKNTFFHQQIQILLNGLKKQHQQAKKLKILMFDLKCSKLIF
jgi:dynein heavy chain